MARLVFAALALFCLVAPALSSPDVGDDGRIEFALALLSTPVNGVNHATAMGQTITTTNTPTELSFAVKDLPGSYPVQWLSVTKGQSGDTWQELGNMTFADGSGILFRSFGLSGHIKQGPGAGDSYGAITYDIYGGFGKYESAAGVMVDTFIGPAHATSFPINAWGFFWLNSSKSHRK